MYSFKKHTGFPQVIYDADELLRGNDDSIADDVIQMFSSEVRIYELFGIITQKNVVCHYVS